MLSLPISVQSRKETDLSGFVLTMIKEPGQMPLYGVYWSDENIRQGGLDFRQASELVWGPVATADGVDEDDEADEDDSEDFDEDR